MKQLKTNNTALVLLSGGMDSSCLLTKAVADFGKENVTALFICYGSTHYKQEYFAAVKISGMCGVSMLKVDLRGSFRMIDSSLTSGEGSSYEVPFRNGIFLSYAVSIAKSRGIRFIATGIQIGDNEGFPDCRQEFLSAMERACIVGSDDQCRIINPFSNRTKAEVILEGIKHAMILKISQDAFLNVPYSCYKGGKKHCGECPTCIDRKKGFDDLLLFDPKL